MRTQTKLLCYLVLNLSGCNLFFTPAAVREACANSQVAPREFLDQPMALQQATFVNYNFDTQYCIYLEGTQIPEAHNTPIDITFAQEGPKIVQPLEKKLANAYDDLTVRHIVRLFLLISIGQSYDVAGDKPLMELLETKVNEVQDSYWRDYCRYQLNQIIHPTPRGQIWPPFEYPYKSPS
jgi:hypothetical protein